MDILWLQNSVSRHFLANAIATLSEQLITINNVVNGFECTDDNASGGDDDDDEGSDDDHTAIAIHTKCDPTTNTPINRSNETKMLTNCVLINSIRGNVACAHRYRFNGEGIDGSDCGCGNGTNNHQSTSPSTLRKQYTQSQHQYHEQKQQQQQQPQSPQQQHQPFPQLSLSSSHLAWTTKEDINAIGVSVNLDMKKSGTISTYDCDSNYNNTTATATTNTTYTFHSNYGPSIINKFWAQHDVKNDNCNYINNNYNNNNDNGNDNSRNNQTSNYSKTSTPTSTATAIDGNSMPSNDGSGSSSSSNDKSSSNCGSRNNNSNNFFDRLNIDSSSFNQTMPSFETQTKASIHAQPQYDKHASQNSSRNQWWKQLVIVICYLFLLSSSLRICSANKHEGNFWSLIFFSRFVSFCVLCFF